MGLRNPYGVAWGPDGRLYAADNGYDERGSRPIAGCAGNWLIRLKVRLVGVPPWVVPNRVSPCAMPLIARDMSAEWWPCGRGDYLAQPDGSQEAQAYARARQEGAPVRREVPGAALLAL